MISDQLAILLRSSMSLAGFIGFGLGAGLSYWKEVPLGTAIFRGALVCLIFAFFTRMIMLSLFRAYINQIHLRKKAEALEKEKKANEKK